MPIDVPQRQDHRLRSSHSVVMKLPLCVLAGLCVASLVPAIAAADTLDPTTFKQTMRRPIIVVDTAPAGGVQIKWSNGAYDYGYGAWVECATFVNNGPKTATAVRIAFDYLDRDKKIIGKDVLERKGTFSPGAVIEGRGGVMQPRFTDGCIKPMNDSRDSQSIAVVIEGVTYDDGTRFDRVVDLNTAASTATPSPKP
ncbi:MAG TPA: hypothetical protein VGU66_10970 [Candidatus Elarobacter sp.]|nr:hypothetical protein [Candidatus Elarobacter sp.]